MEPTLYEGDRALFRYFPVGVKAAEIGAALGKIVLVRREAESQLLTVKRLIKVLDTGLWVEGDNSESSTDSRHYLTISPREIVGIYLIRYRRAPHRRSSHRRRGRTSTTE
jgi:hypothetical protein